MALVTILDWVVYGLYFEKWCVKCSSLSHGVQWFMGVIQRIPQVSTLSIGCMRTATLIQEASVKRCWEIHTADERVNAASLLVYEHLVLTLVHHANLRLAPDDSQGLASLQAAIRGGSLLFGLVNNSVASWYLALELLFCHVLMQVRNFQPWLFGRHIRLSTLWRSILWLKHDRGFTWLALVTVATSRPSQIWSKISC